MLEKEFIPYEQALALKELGYRDPCFGFWLFNPSIDKPNEEQLSITESYYFGLPEYCILAPTFSQAFKWFREDYGLYADIYRNGVKFVACIEDMILGSSRETVIDEGVEYEEAELACLKKLIEIVKEKK